MDGQNGRADTERNAAGVLHRQMFAEGLLPSGPLLFVKLPAAVEALAEACPRTMERPRCFSVAAETGGHNEFAFRKIDLAGERDVAVGSDVVLFRKTRWWMRRSASPSETPIPSRRSASATAANRPVPGRYCGSWP